MELSQIIYFLAATLLIVISPGPAIIFIVTKSVEKGVKAGIEAAIGLTLGGMVHLALAVFGLSAILMESPNSLRILKFLGAAYLFYIGISTLLESKKIKLKAKNTLPVKTKNSFYQGFFVQFLNPNVAFFFLSFLPQFVKVSAVSVAKQSLLLGSTFLAMAFVVNTLLSIFAARFSKELRENEGHIALVKKVAGVTYLILGAIGLAL